MASPFLDDTPVLSIAAPAFNEEESIAGVVRDWAEVLARLEEPAEIVICNDGSTDRTGAILADLMSEVPALRVVGGAVNRGYGAAVCTAIAACRGQYILTIDSDGQFDLADAAELLAAARQSGAAAVCGYRQAKRDSLPRVVADRVLNLIVRTMFACPLRDTNCAVKLIDRPTLQGLRLEATGFPLPTEICVRLVASGVTMVECPVRHHHRMAGESKLRVWRTGWRMWRFLWYLRKQLSLARAGIVRRDGLA